MNLSVMCVTEKKMIMCLKGTLCKVECFEIKLQKNIANVDFCLCFGPEMSCTLSKSRDAQLCPFF